MVKVTETSTKVTESGINTKWVEFNKYEHQYAMFGTEATDVVQENHNLQTFGTAVLLAEWPR